MNPILGRITTTDIKSRDYEYNRYNTRMNFAVNVCDNLNFIYNNLPAFPI